MRCGAWVDRLVEGRVTLELLCAGGYDRLQILLSCHQVQYSSQFLCFMLGPCDHQVVAIRQKNIPDSDRLSGIVLGYVLG